MREYDDDNIRLYTPVLQRVIILLAVIIAVPVVMWTITTMVRTYVAPPKAPTFQRMTETQPTDTASIAAAAVAAAARPSQPRLRAARPAGRCRRDSLRRTNASSRYQEARTVAAAHRRFHAHGATAIPTVRRAPPAAPKPAAPAAPAKIAAAPPMPAASAMAAAGPTAAGRRRRLIRCRSQPRAPQCRPAGSTEQSGRRRQAISSGPIQMPPRPRLWERAATLRRHRRRARQ